MSTKDDKKPVEGEVIEDTAEQVKKDYYEYHYSSRRGRAGLFFGTILLVWGLAILSDTYLGTQFTNNIWPILAVVFGVYLVFSSFNKREQ